MGLDMYATTRAEQLPAQTDFPEQPGDLELHYWRKHPNLHGWMSKLYYAKGGTAASFNCVTLEITLDDLDRLETDVRDCNLPTTVGFFFGESDGTETEDDLNFITKAREAIADGKAVYYTSWW